MKTAIVTGGGSGIGAAVARVLAGEGFRVGLIGRRGGMVEAVASEIKRAGGEAWWAAVDVRDEMAVGAFVESAVKQYRKIDLLVYSAGVFEMRLLEKTTVEFWDETLDINLKGAFICAKAVWPHIGGGQIINISSVAGVKAYANNAAYCASKFGLNGLSEVLALEGKARDIRVHVVCPGNTRTPIWGQQAPAEVQARMMKPEEVAEIIRWLAVSPVGITFGKLVVGPFQDLWG